MSKDAVGAPIKFSTTNIGNGTTNCFIDMIEWKYCTIQCTLTGTLTVTVHGSVQDDGTTSASATYQDITSSFFGVSNITSTGMFVMDTPSPFRYLKVQVVAAGGGTDDYNIYVIRKA